MAQPMLAMAVQLVRDAMRHQPVEIADDPIAELEAQADQSARWALFVEAKIQHLDEKQRASLLSLTARLAAGLVPLIPDGRGDLFLALMAGAAEDD